MDSSGASAPKEGEIDNELFISAAQLLEEEALVATLFRGVASGSPRPHEPEKTRSSDPVETALRNAEVNFLTSDRVSSEGVGLGDVASRFKRSRVPEQGLQPHKYVRSLVADTVQDAVHTSSPVMIGHMTSSLPYYTRPLSRLLTTMNQNSVKTETSNTVTFLEREALAELHRAIYKFDDSFYAANESSRDTSTVLGHFTSGGTISNVTALWVARNRALPDCDSNGMFKSLLAAGKTDVCVVGSELLHYSMGKALDVLGLGSGALIKVPVDANYRAPPEGVRKACAQAVSEGKLILCIVGLAGSTEVGSFDDLSGLADVAKEFNAHFHVDAAWGGPFVFSKQRPERLAGLERCDTVTMDGHKQLYVPMGCGMLFFRDPEFSKAVRKTAKYIIREDSHDLGKFTLEGSRPANAVYLHSNLHILGARGYELLVDRSARMARYMAKKIRESDDFELLVEPQSNILLYRAAHKRFQTGVSTIEENTLLDTLNVKLQEEQKRRGATFVSRTSLRSPLARHPNDVRIVALRCVIANPLTYETDIDRVLQDQREILARILEGFAGIELASVAGVVSAPLAKHEQELKRAKRTELDAAPSSSSTEPDDDKRERLSAYWLRVWETMTPDARGLFHEDFNQFLGSLVNPALAVEDGLFKEERYEKHLKP